MKLRPREAPGRCVYCRDAVGAGAETCAGCGASYHLECLRDELENRCAVPGCHMHREVLRVTREDTEAAAVGRQRGRHARAQPLLREPRASGTPIVRWAILFTVVAVIGVLAIAILSMLTGQ